MAFAIRVAGESGDANDIAGVGGVDHAAVAVIDPDVVDRGGIAGVGREEEQVAGLELRPGDVNSGVVLVGGDSG